jgi:hypothetical protein
VKIKWTTGQINFVLKQHAKGYSRKEIAKMYHAKYLVDRSQDSIKHCIDVYGLHLEKELPKVLILDIENTAMTVKAWGLFDQNIALNQIVQESSILSWSAKWLGSNNTFYKDVKGDTKKEKELLQPLWDLMDEADIILGQNSKKFDVKKLNAKFIEHKMGRPSFYKQIDTLELAKRHFQFPSNKLEWMSKKFCKVKKLAHKKFPGYELWSECEKGNPAAWREMKSYNMADVDSTEELFLELAKFDNTELVTSAVKAYEANKKKK